jgi:hypothetical protein
MRLLFSATLWSAAWYLFTYLLVGSLLFAVAVTAGTVAVSLSFTLAGIPLLLAAAAVIRWCADVERARLRRFGGDDGPVERGYRPVEGQRLLSALGTRWHDPATWRDVSYVLGLYAPLLALDAAVLYVWLASLAGITLPAWYEYPRHTWTIGAHVGTLPKAVAVAAVCLVLFPLWSYVLVATARLHARVASTLLRPPQDPLWQAKEVLASPGPLERFMPNAPVASGIPPGVPPTGG